MVVKQGAEQHDTTQGTQVSEGVEEKIVLICFEDFGAIFASVPARLFTDTCK